MKHTLAKMILIPQVIELIASKYCLSIDEARDKFYKSTLPNLLDDNDLGLYGESPYYLLSIFESNN